MADWLILFGTIFWSLMGVATLIGAITSSHLIGVAHLSKKSAVLMILSLFSFACCALLGAYLAWLDYSRHKDWMATSWWLLPSLPLIVYLAAAVWGEMRQHPKSSDQQ